MRERPTKNPCLRRAEPARARVAFDPRNSVESGGQATEPRIRALRVHLLKRPGQAFAELAQRLLEALFRVADVGRGDAALAVGDQPLEPVRPAQHVLKLGVDQVLDGLPQGRDLTGFHVTSFPRTRVVGGRERWSRPEARRALSQVNSRGRVARRPMWVGRRPRALARASRKCVRRGREKLIRRKGVVKRRYYRGAPIPLKCLRS